MFYARSPETVTTSFTGNQIERHSVHFCFRHRRSMARACSHAFATFLRLIPSSSSHLKRSILFSNQTPLCFQPLRLFRGGRAFHEVRRGGGESIVTPVRRRLGGVRAAQVNESGSIDSPMMQSMETKIKEELSADTVTVKDAYGDGRHVSIYVVSSAFEGQSSVNRQRMVYKAIWEELQSTVHAVDQMITRTPAEAEESQ